MGAQIRSGSPTPLGATPDANGVNFAIFSAHAEAVELCLFDASSGQPLSSDKLFLPQHTDDIWHGYVPNLGEDVVYAYRVHGPSMPNDGHRFDANRLLIDPYARALTGPVHGDGQIEVPKARIVSTRSPRVRPEKPAVPWSETVIYETHVRGYTMLHPGVAENERGTFAGLAHPDVIAHLQSLGVTTLELMPCQCFVDDSFLTKQGLVNYWGYNTVNFFTPDERYQSSDSVFEFAAMVDRFHEAGIEVILDVVYNHTAEGDHRGSTFSFRGIDNASYYRLDERNQDTYLNYSGCGNTLDVRHPRVLQMVTDSLRYWAEVMGVDGFRFDLATTLCRGNEHFDSNSNFLNVITQDPVLSGLKLIAEPWDIGPDGYRLGQYPNGWSEWNDRYRDCVRRYWRDDNNQRAELARRLLGSSDLFERPSRRSWASTNFVASHDGFTLTDITRYEDRHNEKNGEDNRDGHSDNAGRNWGVEGPTEDRAINRLRDRHRRNMLATLLLSQGTPMLLAGDEFGRTQNGNNNAYCQDNETTWIDWRHIDVDADFLAFSKTLIAFRANHPLLRSDYYLHDDHARWYRADGEIMDDQNWETDAPLLILLLDNAHAGNDSSFASEHGKDTAVAGSDSDPLTIIFNSSSHETHVSLPVLEDNGQWHRVLSTDRADDNIESTIEADTTVIAGRSFCVFKRAARH